MSHHAAHRPPAAEPRLEPLSGREEGWFTLTRGAGPVVATAVHAGHALRPEVAERLRLGDAERRREEDPFTEVWTSVAESRLVAHRSRFEVDLNRAREQAVYRRPEDAWGLELWDEEPDDAFAERSLRAYDAFYATLHDLFTQLEREHGRFLVLDLHSYNHRRGGARAAPAAAARNPVVNVGTGAHPDDGRWRPLVDGFIAALARRRVGGRALDVRENVRFRGGHLSRWTHRRFPDAACVLAIELKKVFMDEWSGEGDRAAILDVRRALAAALPAAVAELAR